MRCGEFLKSPLLLIFRGVYQHPELYWSLRGGGGGVAGVVVDFVVRTHDPPQRYTGVGFSGTTTNEGEFRLLFERSLEVWAQITGNHTIAGSQASQDAPAALLVIPTVHSVSILQATDGGFGYSRKASPKNGDWEWNISMRFAGYDSSLSKQKALLKPVLDWIHERNSMTPPPKDHGILEGKISASPTWEASRDWDPAAQFGVGNGTLPWGGPSPNDKAGNLVWMMSRYVPTSYIRTATGRKKFVAAMSEVVKEVGGAGIMRILHIHQDVAVNSSHSSLLFTLK